MAARLLILALAALWGCAATRSGQPTRSPATPVSSVNAADLAASYTREQARAQVRARLTRYYRDFSARDWDAFASHFWEGATITTVWTPPGEAERRVAATTIPQFVADAGLGPDSKAIFEETMGSTQIFVHENLALVWAEYRARFGNPGEVAEWSAIDAFTLMKHNGVWKITSMAFAAE